MKLGLLCVRLPFDYTAVHFVEKTTTTSPTVAKDVSCGSCGIILAINYKSVATDSCSRTLVTIWHFHYIPSTEEDKREL